MRSPFPLPTPHPLRARRCATPWSVLIYRLSPVCCCIGGVRLSRLFCSAGRESGPRSGPDSLGYGNRRSLVLRSPHTIGSAQSPHNQHRRIQNPFQYIVTYHNAEQRRARKGGARGGKAGFVTPSAFPPRKPAHCSSVPLKGKRHCSSVPLKGKRPPRRSVRQTPDSVQYLVQFSH